ncbi:malonyl-CoA decarboxylase, mitochondrial [Fopius arisanus]|uniref:Malonyl-CoA decarboxylase, mitochondrial n=1 Tax=Fopius arisanus TaxID=64838 RepID=A0A9R1TWC6_9HYME|nr:PREDICTED: malonyl-CoA decarboxylase, mitochondrial-like [Fopius arisanus]
MFLRTMSLGLRLIRGQDRLLLRRNGLERILRGVYSNFTSRCPGIRGFSSELNIPEDLDEIFRFKDTNMSNWIVESKVRTLCCVYKNLSLEEKKNFLWTLAHQYSVDHREICTKAERLLEIEGNDERQLMLKERALKNALTPQYQWLFVLMGRLEEGVKFLVDLRTDVLRLLSDVNDPEELVTMQQLNLTLHDLLLLWFSVGFLHLERITWQSSCDMLQKISDYEAIHPIKSWLDLKKRVGPYRRCFVFTHPSMPREPLVVLHTALCDIIPGTVKGIEEAELRMTQKEALPPTQVDTCEIKAAIFYSISATQKGLKGIELGNYLIKEVAREVTREFPLIDKLATMSPIPKFRLWFLENVKQDSTKIFTKEESEVLKNALKTEDLASALKKLFNNSLWINDSELASLLKTPLLRSCAWYLYREKRRNYALNNVANFHLRNGAIMWRINWLADPSPRGAEHSCGIMVNYRYFLDDTEDNSRNYIEHNIIKASESVITISEAAAALRHPN